MNDIDTNRDFMSLNQRLKKQARNTGMALLVVPIILGALLSLTVFIHGSTSPVLLYVQLGGICAAYLLLALIAYIGWPVQSATSGLALMAILLFIQWWFDPVNFYKGWHVKLLVVLTLVVSFVQAVRAEVTLRKLKGCT